LSSVPRDARRRAEGRAIGAGSRFAPALTGGRSLTYNDDLDFWRRPRAMVPVELVRVIIDERCDEQAIFLRDAKKREIPIVIGIFEATVIDRLLKERRAERPLTHDLLAEVMRALGGRLERVEIDDFEGGVFFAKLRIARAGAAGVVVDCRPSDAVALALREDVPILVAEKVFEARPRPKGA
jgi:bifunctional DNase/RNase